MSEETRERSFDELAKGLAAGTVSRGKALRLMGAALVGGALASVPGVAWAAKPAGERGCSTAGFTRVKGRCVCRGSLLTPVGGGEPICSCGGQCRVSCADCPSGTICVQGGPCEQNPPGTTTATCASPC